MQPEVRAAGILLRTADGRALFLKRNDGQGWAFPGGKIEDSETPEQAARRETEEETAFGIAGSNPLTEVDNDGTFVTFGQEVEEFEPKLNEEHSAYCWASIDAPPEPLHPGVAETLKRLGKTTLGAHDRREYDSNGWYEVLDNPLSKVGVYPYSEASVVRGGDRDKMIGVFRPPEELSSDEAIRSFRLMPWTDDHPRALLGDEGDGLVPAEKKGVHGVIGEQVYFRDGTLYGNVKVFSELLAKKIASGKRELSCGYHCDFIPQEGVYEGQPYQYVQRNIRGNHVSLVDEGRMGPGVRVLDAAERRFTFSLDIKEPAMAEPKKRADEAADSLDPETHQFIVDSFNSLVSELERKGYSKEYATKVAGKVAAEKGMTGHHDSTDKVATMSEKDTDETKAKEAADRKAALDARDSLRAARDARRAKDMTEEEEEGEDAAECAEDAAEEKEDEKDESKEARDRRSARDRRAGARDARKFARDKARSARDAKKVAGMDAAQVTALVQKAVASSVPSTEAIIAAVRPAIRKEEASKAALYGRLSPIIGAFDHAEMTHADMAAYGLKKLSAPEASDPVMALDYLLAGRNQAPAAATRSAQDSATGASFLDAYLAA